MSVRALVKSIQDIMRQDTGVDGDAQRISQLCWMFFLKIFDDREAELELLEDDYESPLPDHLRWRNWAKDPEGITGDALSDFVNNQLFPTLKEKLVTHGPAGDRARVIRNVFEDAYNYMKSGTLMRQVINKICEIDFNSTSDRHTFGSIYEQILRDLQSAGNAGEFYTPRAVTRFIVNRVDPTSWMKSCSTPPAVLVASSPAPSTTSESTTSKPAKTKRPWLPQSVASRRKPFHTCWPSPT